MEEIAEYQSLDSESPRKPTRKTLFIIISIVCIILVAGGSLAFYFYNKYNKNTYYFLQELSQYDDDENKFIEALPRIIGRTKTPIQYLMVLKRLDRFNATRQYRNILLRALYKYPNIHSFLALGLEYYLSHYDGYVFEDFFEKVDNLWNDYPNLVRLYYIQQYETKKIHYQGDEILYIFYDIEIKNYTWNTLKILWQLTDEPTFLYLASVQAEITGKKDIAMQLFDELPVEWQSLHTDYYIELAWILKDTEFLLPIVKSNKHLSQYVQLASYYVLDKKPFRAFNLLTVALENLPEGSIRNPDFLALYFWLAIYHVNQKNVMLHFLEKMPNVKVINAQLIFLFYLYQYNPNKYYAYINSLPSNIMDVLSRQERYQYFRLTIENASIEQRKVFLWNLLNKRYLKNKGVFNNDDIYWIKVAANFFLNYRLLNDFLLLYDKYRTVYTVDLIPYYLYFKLNFVDLPLTDLEIQNLLINTNINNFPWWFFYNMGVWKLNLEDLVLAQEYFEKALSIIELKNAVKYKEYLLAQLVRTYIQAKNLEKAEETFLSLTTLFPVNPLTFSLESSIKQLRNNTTENKE